ncbi:hypothetical protein A3J20_02585 [Candidatus Gottesmanbacteria bacterium RIFCSPLOWO2_02_FULL_42_29]|uniref:O-antigen ligase-related domain-containing protein n=1 Tax=Candidatus Gottesmanbacteria bacterium RIFCSPHIGHO2_02_FULL_39_14 TaxID=1798383 RepID=A0A1F5ZU11_9BACT|nr:MAG: hypothetical protein A3D78_05915 [Candidatus Gottesmanbacteria bacterium RIFCSPHIGHO2_02_FULL_39_14]OGG37941.1 MAG: hypothetical protein A3J20_02585 [Candidatus Gottesmanbacteria bacterium RIFCSPLOWO2_02_FULL_42_29]
MGYIWPVIFLLPVIESFNRQLGLVILLVTPFLLFRKITFDKIDISFLLFIAWLLIVLPFSSSYYFSLLETGRYFAYFLIFVLVRHLPEEEKAYFQSKWPIFLILNSLVLITLWGIFTLIPSLPQPSGMNLFYPSFGHNRLAALLIMTLPVLIFKMPLPFFGKYTLWLLPFLTIMLFLTRGRGAIISLLLGLGLTVIWQKRKDQFGRFVKVFILLGIAFLFLSHFYSQYLFNKGKPGGFYKPIFFEQRFEFYRQGLSAVAGSPVTGYGLDTFRYLSQILQSRPLSWSWYSHNHFLDIAVGSGLIGLALFLIWLLLSFREVIGNRTIKAGTVCLLLASLIHNQMDYDWQYLSLLFYFIFILALYLPRQKSVLSLNSRPFLLILTFFILVALFLPSSEKLLKGTENAYAKLNQALFWDKGNRIIYLKLADWHLEKNDYERVHFYLQEAIKMNPQDSRKEIRADYLLYLKQAGTSFSQGKRQKAYVYLKAALDKYPLYHRHLERDIPSDVDFYEYLENAEANVNKISFSPEEIKALKLE